jgi:hypothetical protein
MTAQWQHNGSKKPHFAVQNGLCGAERTLRCRKDCAVQKGLCGAERTLAIQKGLCGAERTLRCRKDAAVQKGLCGAEWTLWYKMDSVVENVGGW